jgi:hypothetical protein
MALEREPKKDTNRIIQLRKIIEQKGRRNPKSTVAILFPSIITLQTFANKQKQAQQLQTKIQTYKDTNIQTYKHTNIPPP